MHLAKLIIKNFRKLAHAELTFQPGLNVLVGGNNVGKTAVVDALRALLAGYDEPFPRVGEEDVHRPLGGASAGDIVFEYVFSGLGLDDEADFLAALVPDGKGKLEACPADHCFSGGTSGCRCRNQAFSRALPRSRLGRGGARRHGACRTRHSEGFCVGRCAT